MVYQAKRARKGLIAAWSNLYGSSTSKLPLPKKRLQGPRIASEADEQIRFVNWLDDKGIKHYAVPNGRTSSWEGAKYQRLGSVAGVPDVVVPYARGGFCHLYIEMKRTKGGVVSPEQKEWIEWLNNNGSKACVCYGAEEAMKVVLEYMG